MKIKKILIANRGEIAIRVIQTCRDMGIQTVTLYTEPEKSYPHAHLGDEAYNLGEGPLSETYLNIDKIIKIAKETKADAIHPGYGFLSENTTFCKRVKSEGIIFIGPSEEAITLMGSKKESKIKINEIGAPAIPGYHGDNQEADFLKSEANKIGYPVLVKASAGGGGKGMRVVHKESEFIEGLESAKREAMNAFGDDTVLIEKYIQNPRHIEVQVMSDSHGNHLHFFERECSIQRRHQKIIEETPSVALSDSKRKEITESAVNIARSINYLGAGTVEFIYDEDDNFYFLEMNTRLQVEHPITEMVTGVDLVRLQIEVASGEKLKIKQEDIKQSGHSIEMRIYAEDPDNNFMPQTGKILKVGEIFNKGVRLDSGYVDGNEVTINFDPMLAKLTVHAQDRESCINKALNSLHETVFLGVSTNRDYLGRILKHSKFKEGVTFTHFVETYKDELKNKDMSTEEKAMLIASYLYLQNKRSTQSHSATASQKANSWDRIGNLRLV